MPKAKFADLKEELSKQHNGDTKQLEVIFSDSRRLIVEAPAGYGKTTTMISRIAFLFASGSIPNPKRILALTFSVNAALKVKREVAEKLPKLMGAQNNPNLISEKVYVTNYHGFCRGVLKRYGYLISDALRKDVRLFKAVDDSDIRKQQAFKNVLSATELQQVEGIENSIKSVSMPSIEDMHEYNKIIINKLLPLDYITHNSVILFTLEIFNRFPEIIKFYRSYYPLIIVDEFQDTNCIAWALLEVLISNHTQLLFLGDPLQRIYGFIGALPDIMSMVTEKYNMTKVVLEKNYRFGNNPEMLKLDSNVRENAATYFAPILAKKNVARLPAFWCSSQQEEAQMISAKVQSLISKSVEKVAILFTRRGKNAEIIESELSNDKIPYFYGMFTDDDIEYVDFHIKCQEMFIKQFGKTKNISKKALSYFVERIKEKYCSIMTKTVNSLLKLLAALVEKVYIDYSDLSPEDKYTLLLDIFENKQLKQAIEYVDSQVILSTIHGAKGLEWDYVILPDVEQWVFTFVCYNCPSRNLSLSGTKCRLPQEIPEQMRSLILDDLCVFYVGLTRAKKQAFISASAERFNTKEKQFLNGKVCCFALIDGIELIHADRF